MLSFINLGIYWNNHHHMLQLTRRITGGVLWPNLHLLFWLSLIPFTTNWMGENEFATVPTALYGVVLLGSAMAWWILQNCIVSVEGPQSPLAAALGRDRKAKGSLAMYVAAIALAFVHPWIADALYVAVVLDLYSRRVVGWAMQPRMSQELVLAALRMAVTQRRPPRGLLHHSDQGGQYAGPAYQAFLARHGIRPSMSRRGDCWDNAVVESFFKTLKTELVYHRSYRTRAEAQGDVGAQADGRAQVLLVLDLLVLELVQVEQLARVAVALVGGGVALLGEARQGQHVQADEQAGIRVVLRRQTDRLGPDGDGDGHR